MLKNEGLQVDVWRQEEPMTTSQLIDKCKDVQGLLVTGNRIDKAFLNECSHLKIISQFGAGYDNIDVVEAQKLGIVVGNAARGYERCYSRYCIHSYAGCFPEDLSCS